MRYIANRYKRILPHYRDTPEKRFFKITVMLIVGAFVLMAFAGIIAFSLAIQGPEEILVPDVVGRIESGIDLIAAMQRLQEKGLYAKIQLKQSSSFKKGTVLDQRPRAGSIVKVGRRILLTVSEGPVISSVGDYVGRTLAEVRIELQEVFLGEGDALLKIREPVMYAFHESDPDTIVEQNPAPGKELRENEVLYLDLVISKGPKGEFLRVPSYVGRAFEKVIEEMAFSDIPFTFDMRKAKEHEKPGTIVAQSPNPGKEVPATELMMLTLSTPSRLEKDERFGMFAADLPKYPVLVELELVEQSPEQRRQIVKIKHPGGRIAIPYVVREDARVILLINGTEWNP